MHQIQNLITILVLCSATAVIAGEPIVIAVGEGTLSPKQPQATIAPDGTVHLIFGVGNEVFHCRSIDGGQTYDDPKMAFRVSNLSLGMRRGPRVAATNEALIISAIGGTVDKGHVGKGHVDKGHVGKGHAGDVLSWRSTDGGASWMGPARVNDTADSAREGLHAMTASANGSVWCTWLDLREKRTEIYASQSTDGGATWLPNILVYRSPDGSVCECCHPSIATSGDVVYVLFRNSLAGMRDMYLSTSRDGGQHFEPAKKLGLESWQLNACPMDGGMLAIEAEGSVSTVWRRGGVVFATTKNGTSEKLLGRGEQPWVASTPSGSIAIWTASRLGELFVSPLSAPKPRSLASIARNPVIVSARDGVGPVIACWESMEDNKSLIRAATIDLER